MYYSWFTASLMKLFGSACLLGLLEIVLPWLLVSFSLPVADYRDASWLPLPDCASASETWGHCTVCSDCSDCRAGRLSEPAEPHSPKIPDSLPADCVSHSLCCAPKLHLSIILVIEKKVLFVPCGTGTGTYYMYHIIVPVQVRLLWYHIHSTVWWWFLIKNINL